jgi:hypothetical protein
MGQQTCLGSSTQGRGDNPVTLETAFFLAGQISARGQARRRSGQMYCSPTCEPEIIRPSAKVLWATAVSRGSGSDPPNQ